MSAQTGGLPAGVRGTRGVTAGRAPAVPVRARIVAARLASGFSDDQTLATRLRRSQQTLLACHGTPDVLCAALGGYQLTWEARRQLAFELGELSGVLIESLLQAGFTERQARQADVDLLARGAYRQAHHPNGSDR